MLTSNQIVLLPEGADPRPAEPQLAAMRERLSDLAGEMAMLLIDEERLHREGKSMPLDDAARASAELAERRRSILSRIAGGGESQ